MRAKEFCAGAIFAGIGAAAATGARRYEIGTATQMGPGYFPLLLGLILMLLGAAAMIQAIRIPGAVPLERWPLVPLLSVVAGALCFAALIERAGLVPALIALITVSCYARLRRNLIEVVVICVVVSILSVGIFIYGLQLPLAVW